MLKSTLVTFSRKSLQGYLVWSYSNYLIARTKYHTAKLWFNNIIKLVIIGGFTQDKIVTCTNPCLQTEHKYMANVCYYHKRLWLLAKKRIVNMKVTHSVSLYYAKEQPWHLHLLYCNFLHNYHNFFCITTKSFTFIFLEFCLKPLQPSA